MFYKLLFLLTLLSTFVIAETAPAPGQPEMEKVETLLPAHPTYEHALGKMLMTLVGLIILIFLTLWVIRRLSTGRFASLKGQGAIKILERRALSAKSLLYLIEVEGKRVLIAESHLEVRKITEDQKEEM